jgi:hypothetical protein
MGTVQLYLVKQIYIQNNRRDKIMDLIYGFSDKENAIPCMLIETKYIENTLCYVAKCEGGIITAPSEMFKEVIVK